MLKQFQWSLVIGIALVSMQGVSAETNIESSSTAPAASAETAYARQFNQAQQLSESGRYDEAIALWQKMLQTYPADLAVSNNIAVALMKQKRFDQAQQQLESILHKDPKLGVLWANLNEIYAYQAQQAYQSVFKQENLNLPKGQWILQATNQQTPDESALAQIERRMQETLNLVEAWRQAWSDKDVSTYLSYYDASYVPADFPTAEAWRNSRERSLKRPKFIRIQLDELEVLPLTETTMQVRFVQRYESNTFKDQVRKQLVWQQADETWKIVQEKVIYD